MSWAGCRWRWSRRARTCRPSGRSIAGYLGLFRSRRAELLGRGDPAGYDKRVTTTWTLAFAGLGGAGPAAGLLRLVACCAAEDIPLDVLLRPGLVAEDFDAGVAPVLVPLLIDELARDEAVAGLRRFSLVSAPRGGLVSVHRLVQAITLDQLPQEEAGAWRRAAAAVIGAALPGDPRDPGCWPVFAALLPHAQAALDPAGDGMAKLARYLGESGSYAAALAVQRQILRTREETLGTEHPDTLTARAFLADWTGLAGDRPGPGTSSPRWCRSSSGSWAPSTPPRSPPAPAWPAGPGRRGIRPGPGTSSPRWCRSSSGSWAPSTPARSTDRANLARWTGEAGDAAGARDQFAALLPVLERVSGAEHPDTLADRANLARWTGEAGDAAGARDQFAALVPVHERVLGAEHPATLTDRANLARWTGEAGDAAGARDQFAALVPVRERVSGAEHPATLAARTNLACWTGVAGDAAGARDQFAALVPVRERVLGAEHPDSSPPAPTWPAGPGRRGMRPGPGTSSPRWCRSASGSLAPSTPARSPPVQLGPLDQAGAEP